VAALPKSNYYYNVKNLDKVDKYRDEKALISEIFSKHKGWYGYRRITLEMRNEGVLLNHKTVQKLMKELGLKSKVRAKKYRSYRGRAGKTAPNLLNRQFNSSKPNEKWVTDVSQFAVMGKKYYLSPILDLYNREIISYDLSDKPNFKQVTDMISKAFKKLPDDNSLMLHSDQGWQYQMKPYQNMLKSKNITQSMSRKGNCLDNSVIENFFGLLKSEFFYHENFESTEDFTNGIDEYIYYYNNIRIKEKLDGLSPVQYRLKSAGST